MWPGPAVWGWVRSPKGIVWQGIGFGSLYFGARPALGALLRVQLRALPGTAAADGTPRTGAGIMALIGKWA